MAKTLNFLSKTYLISIKRQPSRSHFSLTLIKEEEGIIIFKTKEEGFFRNEAGGHRFQRVPPTENKNRVHTSTVTVAVLYYKENAPSFDMSQLNIEYYRAGGKGGQHRNKVETACRLRYGDLLVTCADERSKKQNYNRALTEIKRRFAANTKTAIDLSTNNSRQSQIGSGMRGDKIRTYRYQDDVVVDHRTQKRWKLKNVLKGKW